MYSMFHYTDCEQLVFTNFVWFHGIPIWNNECGYLYLIIFCMGKKQALTDAMFGYNHPFTYSSKQTLLIRNKVFNYPGSKKAFGVAAPYLQLYGHVE